MVPRWTQAQRSKVRLARRRKWRSGQRVADLLFLPHSGCWALVLDGTKRLQDCPSSRSFRSPRGAMAVSTPELRRDGQQCKPDRAGNGAKEDNDLVAMVQKKPNWQDHGRGTW